MQRWRRHGRVAPDRYGGGKRSPLAAAVEEILALVTAQPHLTIEELRVGLATSGIHQPLGARALSPGAGANAKKGPGTPPTRSGQMWPRCGPPGARDKPR
jgi:hypothetical protein